MSATTVRTEPAVRVRGLHKTFGDHRVLRGVDLDLVDGAITTLLGPSGTGKSVLIKHLVGLAAPDSGTVSVFGRDLWRVGRAEQYAIRKRCGVLFQDGALFGSDTVFDNVAFPLREHTDKSEDEIDGIVMRRLAEVGLAHAAGRLPGTLSGGMRKRAGFARALVLDPDIVLFDEPDSGLDPVRSSLLNDLILRMHAEHGGTYLLVTHDIATARRVSDFIGVLHGGRTVHYGPAEEAFGSPDPFVRQFLSGESAGPLGMD